MSREQFDGWDEAKRRCRLTDEEIRMARELGFQPKTLIRNIPSPSQQWKLPVSQWVRGLYEEKFGPDEPPAEHRAAAASPSQSEPGNADHPWPDKIRILHECADLDLAVWMTSMDRLKELKRAMSRGLALVQETAFGGVAHHQVDAHLFDAATDGYQGRLCYFGQCPKPGKRECFVRHCGDKPFLRQFSNYRFRSGQFRDEPMVPLFDRAQGFLVRLPVIEEPPEFDPGPCDDDVPF